MLETLDRSRFNRLVDELLEGNVQRNSFARWEVELILAFQEYDYDRTTKRQLLRRYQKSVNRHFEMGDLLLPPDHYLASLQRSR